MRSRADVGKKKFYGFIFLSLLLLWIQRQQNTV